MAPSNSQTLSALNAGQTRLPHRPAVSTHGIRLRLHAFLPRSRANGPGWRAVIWTQGCSLACPGCVNPATHDPAGGRLVSVAALARRVRALGDRIEGVTISGGEPLQQAPAVLALLEQLRCETRLSVLLFSGYAWEEILARPDAARWLGCVDVLIAGRYDARQRLACGLRGSANQTVHFLSPRNTPADLEAVPDAEVVLAADGTLQLTGIAPVGFLVAETVRRPSDASGRRI
jgi:anaerobic ribonucleoside-triphosphate reductase activating protein